MFKKVLCWLLIFQHINIYVLHAATGDIKIQFEEDVTSSPSTSKFRLKLLQKDDKGRFQSRIDTVFETLNSTSRTFKRQNLSRDGDDFIVKTDGSIISLISRQRDNLFTIGFNREGKTELNDFDTKNFIDIATYGNIFAKRKLHSTALSLSGKNFKNETVFKVDNLNLIPNQNENWVLRRSKLSVTRL